MVPIAMAMEESTVVSRETDYIDADGYRANVGIIIMNDDRRVFIGGRAKARGWQFPQGGIRRGERPDEVEVVVAQPGLGRVASARRTPHQKNRNDGQRDHQTRPRQSDQRCQLPGALRCRGSRQEQAVFLGPHGQPDAADTAADVSRGGFLDDGGGAGDITLTGGVQPLRVLG